MRLAQRVVPGDRDDDHVRVPTAELLRGRSGCALLGRIAAVVEAAAAVEDGRVGAPDANDIGAEGAPDAADVAAHGARVGDGRPPRVDLAVGCAAQGGGEVVAGV